MFLVDPDAASELTQVRQLTERMVQRAIGMGGTCTGEHGIGLGKQKYLEQEFGAEAVSLMRIIKKAIDPKDIQPAYLRQKVAEIPRTRES